MRRRTRIIESSRDRRYINGYPRLSDKSPVRLQDDKVRLGVEKLHLVHIAELALQKLMNTDVHFPFKSYRARPRGKDPKEYMVHALRSLHSVPLSSYSSCLRTYPLNWSHWRFLFRQELRKNANIPYSCLYTNTCSQPSPNRATTASPYTNVFKFKHTH